MERRIEPAAAQAQLPRLAAGDALQLPDWHEEARSFWRLRRRVALARLAQMLRRGRLRIALVALLSAMFWAGLFFLFLEGFRFLTTQLQWTGALYADTVDFIYNTFFLSLMVMLTFSSSIILYSSLYRSRETALLLTLPLRTERIIAYKFQEALLFSSWGFVLLGSPLLIAYGISVQAPWHYYLLVLPFMVAFAYLPCAVGAIGCLLVVACIPRTRVLVLVVAGGALAMLAWLTLRGLLAGGQEHLLTATWLEEALSRFQFSRFRLLPSWWLSTGLLEAARSARRGPDDFPLAQSAMFLVLLISNAMVAHMAMLAIGRRVYRASYSGLHGAGQLSLGAQAGWLGRLRWGRLIDRLALLGTAFLTYRMRLLIVKDLRVFRRDPVQWSQFLIFFGLLGLYFINIRRFTYDHSFTAWVNMVSFLNLAVVGLLLSTFTTRFIFPMISLEGSRFWILGLLPIERSTILWGKFLFAAVGSVVPCALLILISDLMLEISLLVLLVHQLACLLLCVGLSGIAVGLGARLPDLREQSPSKIAAGFGGTLNLVVSAIYIVAVVLLTALPCHFYVVAQSHDFKGTVLDPAQIRLWMLAGFGGALLLGMLATSLPLYLGLRAFRRMEF